MSDPAAPSSPSPEPSSGSVPPPPPLAPGPSTGTGLPSNIAAGIACVFPLVGGILFLVLEKKDQFVRFWAMQSLILGAAEMAFSIALKVLIFLFGHLPGVGGLMAFLLGMAGLIISLAFLAVWILTIIKAFTGQEWEIPYIGKIAREQLAKMSPPTSTAP